METVLNHELDSDKRIDLLVREPGLAPEAISKLLEEFKATKAPSVVEFIGDVVARVPLPIETVLEIADGLSENHPGITKSALFLNTARAFTGDETYAPRFINLYIAAGLPLDYLKSHIIAAVSNCYLTSPTRGVAIIAALWAASVMAQEYGNVDQVHELMHALKEFIFNMHILLAKRGTNVWLVVYLNAGMQLGGLSPQILRSSIKLIPRPFTRWSEDLVEMLKLAVIMSPSHREMIDEYIELDDMIPVRRAEPGGAEASPLQKFAEDPQNVHRVRIERDVLVELDTLDAKFKERADSLEHLYQNPELKETLERIDSDPTDFHGRTLKQWLRIVFLWSKDEGHLPVLDQELKDMTGMCSSGHFRRLINVMNGFVFNLEESINEALDKEFVEKTDALIRARPDCDEILCDISTKGRVYANEVAREMMKTNERWHAIMASRRKYLYGN